MYGHTLGPPFLQILSRPSFIFMAFLFPSSQAQDAFNVSFRSTPQSIMFILFIQGMPAVEEFTFDFELSPCHSHPAPGEHYKQYFTGIQQLCDELCIYGCPHTLQSAPMAQPLSSIFSSTIDEAWSPTSLYGTNASVSPSEAPLTPEWLFQSPLAVECQLPQVAPAVETFAGLSPNSFDLVNGCFVDENPSHFINSASLPGNATACSVETSPLSINPNGNLFNFVQPTRVPHSAPTNAKFQCGLCSYCGLH
jgi:hypothetical protein